MGKKPNLSPLPPHPAVVSLPYLGRYRGLGRTMVKLQCPRCKEVREMTRKDTEREMRRPTWKGLCRKCALIAMGEGTHRWLNYRRGPRNLKHINGYALVSPREITDADLPMFRAMQAKSGQPVLEHRWVMAKSLGRPLASNEFVDHMDGNKINNSLDNLRIYIRGMNQPGSCPAHGTHYDEWQRALARIRELEALLRELGYGDRI
jgi:hypothetical protein